MAYLRPPLRGAGLSLFLVGWAAAPGANGESEAMGCGESPTGASDSGVDGGTVTGIAHASCNRCHGASVVKPLVTKAKNVRARHTGAYRPRKALPGGRDSDVKIKIGGEVVARISIAERVRQTLERRRIIAE